MESNQLPLVSIQCLVYNHEPYLRQCLDGFVMQKTNFKFEAIVHDDVSTDGSAAIIREYAEKYPDIIKPIFETENQYSKKDGSLERIMSEACRGKYTAICEGDDYWVDPMKLQKQVDFIATHNNCGLVYTAYRQQNEITNTSCDIFTDPKVKQDEKFKWNLLEHKVIVGTCTTLIESQLMRQILEIRDDFEGYKMGDTQLWFNASRIKGVGYIPEITAIYRKQQSGATSYFNTTSRISFVENCLDLHLHLAYKYGAPQKTINNIKIIYGASLIQYYMNISEYNQALIINKNNLCNNLLIRCFIQFAKIFKIQGMKGLWRLINIQKLIK